MRAFVSLLVVTAGCGDQTCDCGTPATDSTSNGAVTGTASSGAAATTTAAGTTAGSSGASVGSSAGTPATTAATGPGTSGTAATTAATGAGTAGTGGGGVACSDKAPNAACPATAQCVPSLCCDGTGFCAPADAPPCGGLIGAVCPDTMVCVLDARVADAMGVCLSPERAAAVESRQPGCWTLSGGKP